LEVLANMMLFRSSQPQAASKAGMFNRLGRTVLASGLGLSLVGPAEVTPVDGAVAASVSDWDVPRAAEAGTPGVVAVTSPLAGGTSDRSVGPELLRRLPPTSEGGRGAAVLASAWSAPRGRLVRMRVTAYCPCDVCCGPLAQGITASGHRVSADNGRFVAADPALKFGTRLVVPGYNAGRPVRVLDRGGAIRGRSLDVYFDSHDRAREWGVRYLPVSILTAQAS
jgi:3D (Asp-Asp-Asp) domain-containing protein